MKGLRNLLSMLGLALLLLVPSLTRAAGQKVLGFEGKLASQGNKAIPDRWIW